MIFFYFSVLSSMSSKLAKTSSQLHRQHLSGFDRHVMVDFVLSVVYHIIFLMIFQFFCAHILFHISLDVDDICYPRYIHETKVLELQRSICVPGDF